MVFLLICNYSLKKNRKQPCCPVRIEIDMRPHEATHWFMDKREPLFKSMNDHE